MTGGSLSAGMINRFRIYIIPFVAISILSQSCKNDINEIDALTNKSVKEDKAEDVTIIYSEDGNVKVRMFATEFIHNEVSSPPYAEMRKGLKLEFLNDSLDIESTLTARYGRYYENKGNVLIRDSVVFINELGDTLRTEELIWSQSIRKIFTEKYVRINTPDQVMYGEGLEANEDFSWYRILKPKGVVKVNKEEVPE